MSRILERCSWTTALYMTPITTERLAPGRSDPERELLRAANSTTVAIDWLDSPVDILKQCKGLLMVFTHALTDHIDDNLVFPARQVAWEHKLGVCVVYMQGSGGVSLSSDQTGLRFTFPDELQAVMDRVSQHLGEGFPRFAVAQSVAGAAIVEFFSQEEKSISGIVLVSCPMNIERFVSEDNAVTREMVICGKKYIRENSEYLTSAFPEKATEAVETDSLAAFMSLFKMNTDADDLYSRLDASKRPTLLLYALDDAAIRLSQNVDLVRLCRNPNVAVAVTETGGHCGFRSLTRKNWLLHAICEFSASCIASS